jgi:hypothetical protein
VAFEFDTTLDGRHAEVAWSWRYESATISFNADDWRDWDDAKAARVVAHELLHLVGRDLAVTVRDLIDELPKAARPLARERWEHEYEGVTERLARVLTVGWPA